MIRAGLRPSAVISAKVARADAAPSIPRTSGTLGSGTAGNKGGLQSPALSGNSCRGLEQHSH
jgi:hypothetical protein